VYHNECDTLSGVALLGGITSDATERVLGVGILYAI